MEGSAKREIRSPVVFNVQQDLSGGAVSWILCVTRLVRSDEGSPGLSFQISKDYCVEIPSQTIQMGFRQNSV